MSKNVMECPKLGPEHIENLFEDAYLGLRKFYLMEFSLKYNIYELLEEPKTFEQLKIWFEEKGFKSNDNLLLNVLDALVQFGLVNKYNRSHNSAETYYETSEVANIYLNPKSEFSGIDSVSPLLTYKGRAKKWINLEDTFMGKEPKLKENSFFSEAVRRMVTDCRSRKLKATIDYLSQFEEVKNAKSILDVAGGHGLYGIALSYLNEDSKCKIFDLPKVCEETEKYIAEYGSDRVTTAPGDYYKGTIVETLDSDNPEGYDLVFTSHSPGCKSIEVIDKIYDAMAPNGVFVNKQIFSEGIGDKYQLRQSFENIDWNMFSFSALGKEGASNTFKNDLTLDGYLSYMKEKGFELLDIYSFDERKSVKNEVSYKCNPKLMNNQMGSYIIVAKKVKA
ncbi:putative O-methyltransferase YrrM [Methanococcus voltae]|uniref:Putative O-methyltransferase YrrM n=1 Tax=Methanococcus voltae TaxID=2188 RepID=A0A8J7UV60_METVO|nr:class I SAM-dependent methyltransferase [Methanococcus voltae]MBP2202066.1 putative O-methyltransferase YrrM [Methanococcus voltae]